MMAGRPSALLVTVVAICAAPCCEALATHGHKFISSAGQKKVDGNSDDNSDEVSGVAGPWKALDQSDDVDHRNVCNLGKQLPDLYLIGQQKCGTSSLAQDLMQAGVDNVHGPFNDKEFHFFDAVTRLDYALEGPEGLTSNRESWREWMPECLLQDNGQSVRKVLADFTPSYLGLVPLPEEFMAQGPWLRAFQASANAPKKMREMYGEEASDKLNFAIMIREPLAQMQSAWYHAQSFDFKNVCSSCKADSFRDAFKSVIRGLRQGTPEFTQWVWNVMYGRHLEEWLLHFKPSQFYLIPTNLYSKGDNSAICRDLSSRLGFSMECDAAADDVEVTHAWSHEHPPLDDDTSGLRGLFDKALMAQENSRLIDVLANANKQGMGLANYEGETGDKEAIKNWLETGW